MADRALKDLPISQLPIGSSKDVLVFDDVTNAGTKVAYEDFADDILDKINTKVYTLESGNSTIPDQLDALDAQNHQLDIRIDQASGGTPTPVQTAAEMTDVARLYLYIGSEPDYVSGDVYYNNGTEWVDGGKYGFDSEILVSAIQSELEQYLEDGRLANLSIEDGTITRSKVDTSFENTLAKADTAMQPSVYDTHNKAQDVFDYADSKKTAAVEEAVAAAEDYTDTALANFNAFSIEIVDELPQEGEPLTFYLIPNEAGTGYDKYWWITDEDENSMWDTFGSASTIVVTQLPAVGDEDVDYILKTDSGCLFYKYIDDNWEIIAGSIAQVVDELPQTGSAFVDYYVLNDNDVYIHYRWIDGEFCAIGADSLSQDEISSMLSPITTRVTANETNILSLSNTVTGLTQQVNNIDTEGYTYYATISQSNDDYVYTLYEVKDDVETVKSQFTLPSGGGGGGGGSMTNLVVEKITESPVIATVTGNIIIQINYSSTDTEGDQIDGTYSWKIGSNVVASGTLVQGLNTFDLTEYCSVGTQKLILTVTDQAGSIAVKSWTVQIVDIRMESTFNDRYTYEAGKTVNFSFTPYGAVQKTIHFILDGVELPSVTTSASGTLQSYTLPAQTHGAHLLETYITATINNMPIETDHIFKDIIWYDQTSDVPVIGCIYRYDHYGKYTAKQYNTTAIPYVVYDPHTNSPTVSFTVDNVVINTLKLSSASNTWAYKSEEIAEHVLVITCGVTSVVIHIDIIELGYDITPITAGLEFDFNPVGYSNNSVNRLWVDQNNPNVALTVSNNFDWNNGGYQIDNDGSQYFCVKAGSRAYISYNLFGRDPKQQGAEFKCIFKVTNVRNINATFMTCLPTADAVPVGLEMKAHSAYLRTSTGELFTPYSEDDIVEYEYNINAYDETMPKSLIMSYEDGVGARPYLYDDTDRLHQYNPVPITIGSDDCDVHIYRMKAYSSALTDSNILMNFIADSRDSDTMIARYERNQIYNENNMLTPESVANACPDLKVIKIECPHFTNDKKDYVKYTNVECIHKGGDPILDNWRYVNAYHVGQGTTSNEYGFQGRNIDIIFGFDGINQRVSKIALDPTYVTELTLGDGTKFTDGSGKVTLTRNSVPNDWFNIKVNIASSENANNALLQKRYNDFLPYKTPAMRRNSKIKNSMEFYNCVIFIKESDPDLSSHREFSDTDWHFYGIGNLGDSKKTDSTRVNDPTDIREFVVEISDNTLPNSWFQTGVYRTQNGSITYDPDLGVEMVYPISTSQWNNSNNLKRISLYDSWDDSFEFRYDMGTKDGETISSEELEAQQEISKQIWRDMYEFVVTSSNAYFTSHLSDWFIVESPLYWYLFTERYTMIDSRAKNSFYHWGKTYITEAEAQEMGEDAKYYTIDNAAAAIHDGYRFDLWNYDDDTQLGINNSGELTLTYGKEDIDYKVDDDPSSGYIFNAAENIFWRRIRELMDSRLSAMYLDRESAGCWSATQLITEFDNWQNQFPEELWRLDIERKYLRTYQAGTVRFLNEMMNGRKRYQRRQFERDQEAYIGTKYVGTAVRADQIMFRCNTPKNVVVSPDYTLKIVPYSDMYITVLYGNSPTPQQIRAKAGEEKRITTSLTEMDDTAILIYCASRIMALNDLSACYIHDNDFSKASKLKTLIIGNTTVGYSNSFLTTLNMGNNTLLETLDIRNCPNLVGSINLSACGNLVNLYADGTAITSAMFATNGKITHAHLPQTINNLTFNNLNYLTDLVLGSYDNLETFVSEYSVVDEEAILYEALDTLQNIRISGINWTLPTTNLLNQIIAVNTSLLNGEVTISGAIRLSEIERYGATWPDLIVHYDPNQIITQYVATYVNYDGTVLYTQNVDRGSLPLDPVDAGYIQAPTRPTDTSYVYTFSGWDTIEAGMLSNRTITAVYSTTPRTYTVRWFERPGVLLESVEADYGSEVVYSGDIPTRHDEEGTYIYNVFNGWNASTGFIRGDTDVYATWIRAELPPEGKELKDMSVAEVYGVAQSGRAAEYWENKDYIDINAGNDFNFNNVQSELLLENRFFDGVDDVYDTGIRLFDADSKSFTLAIDYEFQSSTAYATLASCYEENGNEGFRFRYSTNPNVQWGNQNVQVGNTVRRNIIVLRHQKGSDLLYIYRCNMHASSWTNYSGGEATSYVLTRNKSTITSAPLVFGAVKYLASNDYDYYAKGWIYWAKIWYDDLGDDVCKSLAVSTHEVRRAEFCGIGRYRLEGSSSGKTNATFVLNNLLPSTYWMQDNNGNHTNAGGWEASLMRRYITSQRAYYSFPVCWRAIMQKCKVNSTMGYDASIGGISYAIVTQEDHIFLPCYLEMGFSESNAERREAYTLEAGVGSDGKTAISFFSSDRNRAKWTLPIPEDCRYISTTADPTMMPEYAGIIKEGDVWERSNNYNDRYMYFTQETKNQHRVISLRDLNSTDHCIQAADGGVWVRSVGYWLRSPNLTNTTDFRQVHDRGANWVAGSRGAYGILICFSI